MVVLGVASIRAKYTGLNSYYVTRTYINLWRVRPNFNIRWRPLSTVGSGETDGVGSAKNESSQRDPLDLSFENTKIAYKSKTSWELLRGIFVMKLSSYKVLVENNEKLLKIGQSILGQRLFNYLMRFTFYGHFVAGESVGGIQPTINRLYSFGVKPILDYSAEEDMSEEEAKEVEFLACISAAEMKQKEQQQSQDDLKQFRYHEKFADRRKYNVTARTYFYMSEAQCEKNTETFLQCIDAVAGTTKSTGFAAIKMTALGRPQLLIQLSEVIARTRKFFKDVTGTEKNMILSKVQPSLFEKKLQNDLQVNTHQKEVKDWLEKMDYDKKGLINLFSWSDLVDMNYVMSELFKVPSIKTGRMEPIIRALTTEEEEMFKNMMRRLHCISRVAREKDVRVMIDAEQTYFQPAISRITMELMRKYNKEKPIIFNTYQCYLKEAYDNVVLDMELADRRGFFFGAKLVRGAYMEQERLRAKTVGYKDPINPTFEVTSMMYHKTLTEIMQRIVERKDRKLSMMVATHNEDTVRYTVNKMKDLGIKPEDKLVCFGQLYGMCDQVSFALGQAGYSVYKYVPYGPVNDVLPYLSRRARENSSVLQKVDKERFLLQKEVLRRIKEGQIFYKPTGNYTPL